MATSLTTKGAATRQRIIEAASAEIREFGVTVTLDDIRARARASKSQLFHYFPEGREQLLLAVARYEAGLVLSDQQPQLGNLTSWAAWLVWRSGDDHGVVRDVMPGVRTQGSHKLEGVRHFECLSRETHCLKRKPGH